MNARQLSRQLADSRARAERAHLATVTRAYERTLRQVAALATGSFAALTAAASADWQPPPEGAVLTPLALTELARKLNDDLEPVWATVVLDIPGTPLARAGIAWDVAHPLAQQVLDSAAKRTGARLGEAVQPLLRQTVADAYAAGLSVADTAASIQAAIAAAAPWQAEMLARTDLNSLANGASHAAARLVGAGYKTWLATLDDRTRLEHADAHGQTVPLEATFDVGGEPLDYPGDPSGSDANTINCRCAIAYADSLSEGQGLLADGGHSMAAMKPQRRAARRSPAAAKPLAAAAIPQVRWVSDLAFEGAATGDGRYILPRALTTRELPLTLMAQTVTDDGHDGAFVAGRIDKGNRSSTNIAGEPLPGGVKAYRAEGIFDMGGANGAEVARLVGDETLRGVSVDLAVQDWVIRDPATGDLTEPADATEEQWDGLFFGDLEMAVRKGEIMAATVCATPAFADARIALAASADGQRLMRIWVPLELVQEPGLLAAAAPARPPRAWFETQEPPGKMPLTITDEGRVFGHLACWDSCHMSFLPACIPPPSSPSRYAYFHVGELETGDGGKVAVGKLMVGGRHAGISEAREDAMRHYDNTSRVGAYLRATDGKHGIWVCGAINPHLSDAQLAELRANPPSGDWRPVNGSHELIAGLSVPVPGFATPRADMELVASGGDLKMGALVAALGPTVADTAAVAELAAAGVLAAPLSLEEREADRRIRVLAARAQGIDALAALADEPAALEPAPAARMATPAVEEPATAEEFDEETGDRSLDDQVAAALGTLAHVTDMASRVQAAEQQAAELAALVEAAREEHRQETVSQKRETLAAIEAMTAQIAAGGKISEAMLAAMGQLTERKPRTVKVVRDDDGRAVAYQEASA